MVKLPKDKLKWVAAAFALVATASAEYSLARAIGMNEWIAAAVPGALDAYAVRALRAHREVLTAVLAMVGVNAASHLVTAGVLHVGWPLITAVSAIAPLVLWRVHALSTPGEHRRCTSGGVSSPLGTASDVPPVPEYGPSTVPDHVPDEWGAALDVFTQMSGMAGTDEHDNVLPFRAPVKQAGTADTAVSERDRAALLVLRLHMADEHLSEVPGIRDIKKICKVSTDRARRVQSMAKGETQ